MRQLLSAARHCIAALVMVFLVAACANIPDASLSCTVPPEDFPEDRKRYNPIMPAEMLLDVETLEACASDGSTAAQSVLAVRLLTGNGIEQDQARGEELLRDAAEVKRHPDAMYNMGAAYAGGVFGDKDDGRAVEWFRQAANANDLNGLYWLGHYLWLGREVEMNKPEAISYFRRAAEQKHTRAAFMLGQAYHSGDSVEKDLDIAMDWYQKANTWAFNQPAQYNIAKIRELQSKEESDN